MANETRHAAWHSERRFAVRLRPEEGDPTELAEGFGDFLEAVEFAVDWLGREDPERTGTASLAIFETSTGDPEKVWAYPPDPSTDEMTPLMKIFGFDPVTWKAASAGYTRREPALGTFFTRAPESMTAPATTPAPAPAPPPEAAPAPTVAPAPLRPVPAAPPPRPAAVAAAHEERAQAPPTPLRPRRALAAAWHDPVARSFLLLAGISLWLAVAFSDAGILAFVLVAVSGLWWRRDKLIAAATTDSEDWL